MTGVQLPTSPVLMKLIIGCNIMERVSEIIGVSFGMKDGQTLDKSEMKRVVADVIAESDKILKRELNI